MFAKKAWIYQGSLITLAGICLVAVLSFETVVASPATKSLQDVFLDVTSGNETADPQIIETMESLLRQYPHDPLLTAYYGSTLSAKAKEAWLPWERKRYVNASVDSLNKSLILLTAPSYHTPYQGLNEGVFVESLAALSLMHLPSHYTQQQRGFEMIQAVMASDDLAYYAFEPKAWIHLGAVKGALKLGKAQTARRWTAEMQQLAPTHPFTLKALSLVSQNHT